MVVKPTVPAQCHSTDLVTPPASSDALVTRRRTVAACLCVLAALVISMLLSAHYLPDVFDDALISYRYSDRLLHGHGLTWNDGEFVEGYSNLLWVLLVAAAGLLQPDLILNGWILGALANAATILAIAWAFGRQSPTWSPIALTSCLVIIACSEAFAFSPVGGLETALLVALLAWALATAYRMPDVLRGYDRVWPSLLFGLLAITRPDGAIFGVSAAVAELVRNGINRRTIKTAVAFGGSALAFVALQLAFRLAYYGSLVPNTATVKLAFNAERILGGVSYVARGAWVNSTVLVTIMIAAAILWRARRWEPLYKSAVFIVPGVAWLTYICLIGGDFVSFSRHWQPAFICAVFAMGGLLAKLPAARPSVTGLIVITLGLTHIAAQSTINPYQYTHIDGLIKDMRSEMHRIDPTGKLEQRLLDTPPTTRAQSRQALQAWFRTCTAIGDMLTSAFGSKQPIIAVNVAGCLPYHTGFPAIDMLGLNDSHIARHRPPGMGKGFIGHELGDGAYVLSRNPDLIVFCANGSIEPGLVIPCFRGDREISAAPEFKRDYRLIYFRVNNSDAGYWTRIEDGRIGIIRSPEQIEIPGFLLATTTDASAMLDRAGRAVTALRIGSARISDITIPPGTWEISLQTESDGNLQLDALPEGGTEMVTPQLLRLTSNGEPRSFRVFGGPGVIYGIIAKRL